MKEIALGGMKEKNTRDQTLKEFISFDCFPTHLLVIRRWSNLLVCRNTW